MPKLAPFDHAGWMNGMTLGFTTEAGRHITLVKVRKQKPVKLAHVVEPAISVLTSEFDNIGRSLEDHRAMIDHYGARYDMGKLPFSDMSTEGIEEFETASLPRNNPLERDTRHAAHNNEKGLKLLRDAFLAMHTRDEI